MANVFQWRFEDFFSLDAAGEINLKKRMAELLGLRWGLHKSSGVEERWANAHGGVPAWNPQALQKAYLEYKETLRDDTMEEPTKQQAINDKKCMAIMVTGLQIRWITPSIKNIGYIKEWREKHLLSWDVSVERRAGGIDEKVHTMLLMCFLEPSFLDLLRT